MKALLIVAALCVLAVAGMVPRHRRENEEPKICAETTPCGWSTYNPYTKIIQVNITNTYCICGEGTSCQEYTDDTVAVAIIYRCLTAPATS